MRFTVIGDIYMDCDETRWYRRRLADAPQEVQDAVEFHTHDEFERELVRKYPITMSIVTYDLSREGLEWMHENFAIYPTDTQTGGIIGGDGGFGWTPAMCWEHEGVASFGTVYGTPWPETVVPITRGHSWDRVANALMRVYG